MVQEATKTAVLSVLAIDAGATPALKAAVSALLSNDRRARIPTPQAATLLGVSKRTMMDRIDSGEWPLAIDYDGPTRSFCYIAQVTALASENDHIPTIEELGVVPRPRPAAMNFNHEVEA